jgi:hypothetical protein
MQFVRSILVPPHHIRSLERSSLPLSRKLGSILIAQAIVSIGGVVKIERVFRRNSRATSRDFKTGLSRWETNIAVIMSACVADVPVHDWVQAVCG